MTVCAEQQLPALHFTLLWLSLFALKRCELVQKNMV